MGAGDSKTASWVILNIHTGKICFIAEGWMKYQSNKYTEQIQN